MRLDKFLKVSRLIKRRTVANEACDAQRVMVNGKPARASYDVKVGDRIVVNGISSLTDGAEIKPITEAQYQEKLKKTEKLGAAQGDLKELKKAFGK